MLGNEDVLPPRVGGDNRRRGNRGIGVLESFRQLTEGDLIVHVDHGIGRYEGLVKLDVGEAANDFIKLVYRDDNLLYVPVQRLDRVQKYMAGKIIHKSQKSQETKGQKSGRGHGRRTFGSACGPPIEIAQKLQSLRRVL